MAQGNAKWNQQDEGFQEHQLYLHLFICIDLFVNDDVLWRFDRRLSESNNLLLIFLLLLKNIILQIYWLLNAINKHNGIKDTTNCL